LSEADCPAAPPGISESGRGAVDAGRVEVGAGRDDLVDSVHDVVIDPDVSRSELIVKVPGRARPRITEVTAQ